MVCGFSSESGLWSRLLEGLALKPRHIAKPEAMTLNQDKKNLVIISIQNHFLNFLQIFGTVN